MVQGVDFFMGDKNSQNVLFHLPDWTTAQKVRLYCKS